LKTYHDSDSVAIYQSSKRPGESPRFLGTAESLGDAPEPLPTCHDGADKPPHTNRGALIGGH